MGLLFWEKAGARNLVFFRAMWLRPAMEGTLCARRVRLQSFRTGLVPPLCSALSGASWVRSSIRFLSLWLQIAKGWLHECCHIVLPFEERPAGLRPDAAKRIVWAAAKFLGISRLRA